VAGYGAILAVGALLAAAPSPNPKGEFLVTPIPEGFKLGAMDRTPKLQVTEYIPVGETVENWSRIVTEMINQGVPNADPDGLPTVMSKGWTQKCPGGSARKVVGNVENGYRASIWMFLCPSAPGTNKPESMWIKVISGSDRLYSVQYAYRSPPTREMLAPTMGYLKGVFVCDTRRADRPCPRTR
jgi:hypothetical protein